MILSKQQKGMFWGCLRRAARNLGYHDESEVNAYHDRVLAEEVDQYCHHVGDIETQSIFDQVLARLSADAGNYSAASRFAGGKIKRYQHLILRRAKECAHYRHTLEGGVYILPADYVAGILIQGKFLTPRPGETPHALAERLQLSTSWTVGSSWEDLTEETLRTVLQILTAESYRLHRRVEAERKRNAVSSCDSSNNP